MADDNTIEVVIRAAFDQLQGQMNQAGSAVAAAVGKMSSEVQGSASQMNASIGALSSEISTLSKTIAAMPTHTAALGASMTSAVAPALQKTSEGAKKAAAEVEHLGHSSTAARRELIVLAHEMAMGNYSRFGGSLMVLAERFDVIGKLMSPIGLSIAAATVAVGTFIYEIIKGAAAATRFANSLQLTGNYAGVTAGQVEGMARRVEAATGATIGSVSEVLQNLVATGAITRESLESTAAVVEKIAALSGGDASKIAAEFAKMGDDVAGFAAKHQAQFGNITAAQIAYIQKLQETEGAQAAAKYYTEALSGSLGNATQNFGYLERSLHGVEGALSSFVDWMRSIGTDTSPEERVRSLTDAIEKLKKAQGEHSVGYAVDIANLEEQLKRAQSEASAAEAKADQQSKDKQHQISLEKAREYHEAIEKETRTAGQRLSDELAQYRKQIALLDTDPKLKVSAEQQAKDIAAIRAKYTPKGGSQVLPAMRLDLKPLEDSVRQEGQILTDREQALARSYRNDLIGTAAYFEKKREALEQDVSATKLAYKKEIEIVRAAQAKARSPAQRSGLETQLIDLQDKLTQAMRVGAQKRQAITDEEAAETDKYRKSVDQLRISLLELQGNKADAVAIKFDNQNDHLKAQAQFAHDTGAESVLAQVRELTIDQAKLNDLNEQAQLIQERLGTTEARINLDRQVGVISEIDGMRKLQEARTAAAAQLDQIYQKQKVIADASNDPRLIQGVEQFKVRLDQLRVSADLLGAKLESIFEGSLAGAIDRLITGTGNLRDVIRSFFLDLDRQLAQLASQDMAKRILGSLSGGAQNGIGGLLSSLMGSSSSSSGGGFLSSLFSSSSGASSAIGSSGGFSSLLGSSGIGGSVMDLSSIPGLATGGAALPNSVYQFAENGPEFLDIGGRTLLVTGNQGGTATPARFGSAPNQTTVVNNYHNYSTPIDPRTRLQVAAAVASGLATAQRRNG